MNLRNYLLFILLVIALPQIVIAETITLYPSKDTFLRNGAPNTNEGGNKLLSVRKLGRRTALVAFDLTPVAQAGNKRTIQSAKLKLYIAQNDKNWGKNGRTLGAYKILTDWTEGNGSNARRTSGESDDGIELDVAKNRGSGSGSTWKCATDTNIKNVKRECSVKSNFWKGGYYGNFSSMVTVTNTTNDYVEFDVTDDVIFQYVGTDINEGNYGWAIKRTSYALKGSLWFYSREASAKLPELLVTFE
jgi:hypothetical protein